VRSENRTGDDARCSGACGKTAGAGYDYTRRPAAGRTNGTGTDTVNDCGASHDDTRAARGSNG
jgi:hypothetical protein